MDYFNLYIPCKPDCDSRGVKSFYTALNEEIKLKGNWEVALGEISFKNTFTNIKNNESIEIYSIPIYWGDDIKISIEKLEETVKPNYYTTKNLIKEINNIIKPYNISLCVEDNVIINLALTENDIKFPIFSENLCNLLGFDREELIEETKILLEKFRVQKISETYNTNEHHHPSGILWRPFSFQTASYYPKLSKERIDEIFESNKVVYSKYIHKLFENHKQFIVCSDLCESSLYGAKEQQILRIVNYDNMKFLERKAIVFKNPYFIKVKKNPFQMIKTSLMANLAYGKKEIQEEYVDFKFNDVNMLLIFRKINENKVSYDADDTEIEKEEVIDPFEVETWDPDTQLPPRRINP